MVRFEKSKLLDARVENHKSDCFALRELLSSKPFSPGSIEFDQLEPGSMSRQERTMDDPMAGQWLLNDIHYSVREQPVAMDCSQEGSAPQSRCIVERNRAVKAVRFWRGGTP